MNRNFFWLGAAVLVLLVITGYTLCRDGNCFGGGQEPDGPGIRANSDGEGDGKPVIKLPIASSSTKKAWMEAAKTSFNEASKRDRRWQVDGRPVEVEYILEEIDPGVRDHYRSGTMTADIQRPDGDPLSIRPVVASPSEASWLAGLNRDWKPAHGQEIIREQPAVLVRIPVVIAMWESRARALGCWPTATPDCTWGRIRKLADSSDGWGSFGHPEWGQFKFGYGYVGESNSGTMTALLLCMTGVGKTTGLTVADVDTANGCGQTISTVEKAVVHRGKKSGWLLDFMKTRGPEYLDAMTTNEPDVIKFNLDNRDKLREPLVSAYPQDGTVVSEHPYGILDGAPWVNAEQVKAAELFRDYLLSPEMQTKAIELRLRPADRSAALSAPIDASNGADPAAGLVAVSMPDAIAIDQVVAVWHKVKKHVAIAIVFDKSGSMSGERLTQAVKGAQAFVNSMDPDDWLRWMPFDAKIYGGAEGLKSGKGEQLTQDIRGTTAGGSTALYDAVYYAYEELQRRRLAYGNVWRYGIVILSDGDDTASTRSLAQLEALLLPNEANPASIQIHAIGIGEANKAVLQKIATAAHGKYWEANPTDIERVYREIAPYF